MSYSSEVLADAPLAYWRQGDTSGTTMTDSSGNSRDGTYAGQTLNQAGVTSDGDKAVAYSTANGASVTGATWMNTVKAYTTDLWLKTTNNNNQFYARGTGASWTGWYFAVTSGKVAYQFVNSGTGVAGTLVTGGPNVNDGAWHHVAVTYDGTNIILYVDKVAVASVAYSSNMPANTSSPIRVGGVNTGVAHFLGCTLDEVAIYGATLSAARIAAHYDADHPSGDVSRSITISAASALRLGISAGASKSLTVATASAGTRGKVATAAAALALSVVAAGTVASGPTGDATPHVTISAASAATLGVAGGATPTVNVATSSAGVRGKTASAAPQLAVAATSSGVRGQPGTATRSLTIAVVADGTVTSGSGSTIRLADGTTLINPRYADGSPLTVLGWLDADGVTIHPFA